MKKLLKHISVELVEPLCNSDSSIILRGLGQAHHLFELHLQAGSPLVVEMQIPAMLSQRPADVIGNTAATTTNAAAVATILSLLQLLLLLP